MSQSLTPSPGTYEELEFPYENELRVYAVPEITDIPKKDLQNFSDKSKLPLTKSRACSSSLKISISFNVICVLLLVAVMSYALPTIMLFKDQRCNYLKDEVQNVPADGTERNATANLTTAEMTDKPGCVYERDAEMKYTYIAEPKNWDSAFLDCRQRNQTLAFLDPSMIPELTAYNISLPISIWISGKRHHGTFYWYSPVLDLHFPSNLEVVQATYWFPGEPNNKGGIEDCMQLAESGGVKLWNDNNCTIPYPYVCQRGPKCSRM